VSAAGSPPGAGAQGARTRLGVLGWPVAHSRSPAMQNAALEQLGLHDWRYQHLPVPPELFEETTRALGGAGFVGANVTIPHKQAALVLADSPSEAAGAIGAANTLTFAQDGSITAENTDAPGLINAIGEPLAGRRALVLGAGGSARAAVWALREQGAEVLIYNRTPERAAELARELDASAVAAPVAAEVLVNCTSVGLVQRGEELQALGLELDEVGGYEVVVDLVYGGEPETELLRTARAQGARTVDGLEILVAQGALSLESWTGREAPLAVMREAAMGGAESAL
jgi:shikimate dehydrogenase